MKSIFKPVFLSGVFLIGSSVFAFSNTAYANSETPTTINDTTSVNPEKSKVTMNDIHNVVNQTDALELIDVKDLPEEAPFVEFDSLEEFQKAVTDLEEENNNTLISDELPTGFNTISSSSNSLASGESTTLAAAKSRTDVLIVLVKPSWNPLKSVTQPASITVNLTYKYKSGAFTKLSKITSHSLGIPTSWVQENYNYKFYSSKKGIDVELNGYNVVGVAIKGQAIGAKINDTVTFKYKLGGNKRIAEY